MIVPAFIARVDSLPIFPGLKLAWQNFELCDVSIMQTDDVILDQGEQAGTVRLGNIVRFDQFADRLDNLRAYYMFKNYGPYDFVNDGPVPQFQPVRLSQRLLNSSVSL